MSGDKRRRARVQGGWSAAPKTAVNVSSDKDKPKMTGTPAWYGKNADSTPLAQTQPQGQTEADPRAFVFHKPDKDDLPVEAKVRVIEKVGVYDLSTEPTGISRIRFFPNFVEPEECHWMYDQLFHELPWKQRSDYVKSKEPRVQPRLTAWFGEHPYSYSGQTLDPYKEWTPLLQQLKSRIEENTGLTLNSVLANLYRDGHDNVGWHADDEPGLGPQPTIASLSFGDSRSFEMRKVPPKTLGDPVYTEYAKIPLDAGSLLIMEGATQDDWQHRIPREYHDRGPRINLTFRVIFPAS